MFLWATFCAFLHGLTACMKFATTVCPPLIYGIMYTHSVCNTVLLLLQLNKYQQIVLVYQYVLGKCTVVLLGFYI